MSAMLNLEMTTAGAVAVVALSGSMDTADDVDTLDAALGFVPLDDDLVVDLGELDHLGPAGARVIRERLRGRVDWAETVVVSRSPQVTMRLVLADVDRIVAVVPTVDVATAVIRARSYHRAEVA